MKKLEILVALFFGIILIFHLFEVTGINAVLRSWLFELSEPLLSLRSSAVNIYSKATDSHIIQFPEITFSGSCTTSIAPPLAVGFYNHSFGDYVILDSNATPLEKSPVVSLRTRRLAGVVSKALGKQVVVEPLRNLSFQLPAVARRKDWDLEIEGVIFSESRNLYFRSFDPEELLPGDSVFISPEIEGFGYFYSLDATYIGDILSPMPDGYLLDHDNMNPGYYAFLEAK
ncbi:hypothetical protein AT15_00820 [Kosmotoga arenicorallina S304]|uniref:Uncharacterized protein n=1 Tax=Kosmotoga arenicorallina S304 TaxID=1453497 RepID=A0A176K0E1_9BACT|nr:hypothetical protein [Kosmotoga arenicorallina]OAA30088.1 hypothetical protein AT15_00820 [Kosmotoga arenicorallina S304]